MDLITFGALWTGFFELTLVPPCARQISQESPDPLAANPLEAKVLLAPAVGALPPIAFLTLSHSEFLQRQQKETSIPLQGYREG